MKVVGDMWGSGLFKANACDYCDDVTTELADLSLGDAWLEPFSSDGRGTNVIVTRSKIAENIILAGMKNGSLVLKELPESVFLASQQGSYNHRHDGLGFRMKTSKINISSIPPKRFVNIKISPLLKIIQLLRIYSREKSLDLWKESRDAAVFDERMARCLYWLRFFTKINHYQRAIGRRVKKYLSK